MLERRFKAMGTEVELLLAAPPGAAADSALARAEEEFERLEQIMSRFRPHSELSRLNREGLLDPASVDLTLVVELALEAREATAGRFDPTVHDAVVAAGYDRSFDDLVADSPVQSTSAPCGGTVDVEGLRIELGAGTRLDLGGIGKGYAVDRVCELLALAGPCLVNAGGDLAVRAGSWPVGVTADVTLELASGAIATSGIDHRRWRRNGKELHHLIDPATGRPAQSPYARVTVVAGSAAEAEILAKAVFLGAEIDAPRVLVLTDGTTVLAGGLS